MFRFAGARISTFPLENEASIDVMALCPPSAAESLAVPIWLMRRWIDGKEIQTGAVSDVEGTVVESQEDDEKNNQSSRRRVIRWRGRDEAEVTDNSYSIRPGDVIVIPTSRGRMGKPGGFPSIHHHGFRFRLGGQGLCNRSRQGDI